MQLGQNSSVEPWTLRANCLVRGCHEQCFHLKLLLPKQIPFVKTCFCFRRKREASFCPCCQLWCSQFRRSYPLPTCPSYLLSVPPQTLALLLLAFPQDGSFTALGTEAVHLLGTAFVGTPKDSARAVHLRWKRSGRCKTVGNDGDWRTNVCLPTY